jgi:hypothetical protein
MGLSARPFVDVLARIQDPTQRREVNLSTHFIVE